MEQYIVAYFWLIFCIYLICERGHLEEIALWGAGGTLLTSMILLPFMFGKPPIGNIKKWIGDIVKYGMKFIVLILVFGRGDIIFNLASKISILDGFTGRNLTFTNKFYQYTNFIYSCFIAPKAGISERVTEHISWQLNDATGINFIGIIIMLLVIISAIWNRHKKSSMLAIGWVAFSVIMLLVIGWGTKENGLILYTLYFGWAFLILLFQLLEKIESKLKVQFIFPVISVCCTSVLAVINISEITRLINFAITYFPV